MTSELFVAHVEVEEFWSRALSMMVANRGPDMLDLNQAGHYLLSFVTESVVPVASHRLRSECFGKRYIQQILIQQNRKFSGREPISSEMARLPVEDKTRQQRERFEIRIRAKEVNYEN